MRALTLSALSVALQASTALGANITEVADANDLVEVGNYRREDLWDVNIGVIFDQEMAGGKITREPIDYSGIESDCTEGTPRECLPVDELRWNRTTNWMKVALEIGLFHDLALTAGWRYALSSQLKFKYAKGVGPSNSTVDPQTGDPNDTLFPNNFSAAHKGSGTLDLGLRWAPLSDLRDDTKPTWVIFANWQLPNTADTFNPKRRATTSNPGPIGDGVHRMTWGMAFSKRMGEFDLIGIDPNSNRRGFLDPYASLSYTLPIPSGSALRDLRKSSNNPFGRKPSHEGRLEAGLEVVPIEDLKNSRKLALDFGIRSAFVSEGRNYSILTDPLEELTYTEQHMRFGGFFGLYIQAAEFVQLNAGVALNYTTEHFLTFEEAGIDRDDNGNVTSGGPDELNPYFCGYSEGDLCRTKGQPSYDQIGFRFKDAGHSVWNWFASLVITL